MKKKKFDVDKFLDEVDHEDISTSWITADMPSFPKINSKCPKCGSTDWWEVSRNNKGKIVRCSECPDEKEPSK